MKRITHSYDEHEDIIYITVEGKVARADISKTLVELAEQYQHLPELFVISDYRKGQIEADPTYFLLNLNEVKETFLKLFYPFKRFVNAYLLEDTEKSSSTRILLDQFRKISTHYEAFHSKYFDDEESAIAWIKSLQGKD
ncbi:MAG: hypothetical protein HRT61_12785 [Ekhidna sp.]|nr:hypothetical protein [Ekhidna sp.]